MENQEVVINRRICIEALRAIRKARKPRNAHRKFSSVAVKRITARIEKRLYKLGLYNPISSLEERKGVVNIDVSVYVPVVRERIEIKAVIK